MGFSMFDHVWYYIYVCSVAVFVFVFYLGLMFGDLKMLLIFHSWKCGMVIPGWSLFHLYLGWFPFDDFVQEHGSATNKGNDVIIATPECFRTLDLGWGLKATWNKSNSIQGLKTLGKIKYVQLFVRQLVLSATYSDLKLLCHAGMDITLAYFQRKIAGNLMSISRSGSNRFQASKASRMKVEWCSNVFKMLIYNGDIWCQIQFDFGFLHVFPSGFVTGDNFKYELDTGLICFPHALWLWEKNTHIIYCKIY